MILEKTLESPLDCKEIILIDPKRSQSWIFIGRTDAEAEAEATVPWPPDAKNWLTGKDHDAGKNWRQEEKEMTKDEMVWWHHQLNGHEFEQDLGIGEYREGWLAAVHGVIKSWTWLGDWNEADEKINQLKNFVVFLVFEKMRR